MDSKRLLLAVPLLAVSLFIELRAQTSTSGGLTGVVTDPSGAVVPDAEVGIRNTSKGTNQSLKTDRGGAYQFSFLAPARYALTVSRAGFQTDNRTVDVLLGPPVTVNLALRIAQTTTTVSVTAEAPALHAENGDVSTTINQQQVSEVPNPGNDLTYIAQTAPGAIMNSDAIGYGGSGNVSILGMPGTSNLFTLNGMNDNNNGPNISNNVTANTNNSGVTGMMLGQNEVQEATVVSDGYSGQFGSTAGSSVNYLTKSGGNAFHGNSQYYWNGTVLNANDWISNASKVRRPSNIAHQWAASLGGPIKKDKLFFFFDTEGLRLILPYSTPVVLPSPKFESQTLANIRKIFGFGSASYDFYQQMFDLYNSTPGASAATPGNNPSDPLGCNGWTDPTDPTQYPCAGYFHQNGNAPSNDSIVSGRADWNAGASDRVFLFVQNGQGRTPFHVDPIPVFNAYCNQSTWQGHLSETHAFGPTASNQFLLGGNFVDGTCSVANSAKAEATFPTEMNWYNAGIPFLGLGGYDNHYAKPFGSRTTAYQISDDLVKTRGRHKFALGVNFLRTDATRGGYNRHAAGLLLPLTMGAFFCGGVSPSQDPSTVSHSQPCLVDSNHRATEFTLLQQSFPISNWNHFAFYSLGFYGQDEWRVRSNLTLTLALRADHQSNPVCENRCFTRLTGALNSLSHNPEQPYDSGILTHQMQAYANTDGIVWSPRFSFAWQPLGVSHNTVLRGGVGFFYDPVSGGLASILASNPPSYRDYSIRGFNLAPGDDNSLNHKALDFDTIFVNGFETQSVADIEKSNPLFVAPNFQNPANRMRSAQYQKWSLQAQQTFGSSTSLTVGYFGNHGIHEMVQNPNANAFGFGFYPAARCTTPYVPPCADPRFGGVTELQTNAISNYNGIVVSFEQRFTRWGSGLYQVNYTYGHALDEVSNGGLSYFTTGGSIFPQDAINLRRSYGAAEYDARHSMTGNFLWKVPFKLALGGHGPDSLLKGWQISGTVLARTGNPYTVFDNTLAANLSTNNNFYGPIYSVPVAPLGPAGPCGKGAANPVAPVPCLPQEVVVLPDGSTKPNPNALFVQTGCETGFNAGTLPGKNGPCSGPAVSFAQGRNRFRGPSYVNVDFAVMKNTKIPRWENAKLGIGLQFFNFFNHANFGFPDPLSSDSTIFGQIFYMEQSATSLLGSTNQANAGRRMIQLKAQLQF